MQTLLGVMVLGLRFCRGTYCARLSGEAPAATNDKLPRAAGNGTRWRRSEAISMPSVGSRTPAGPAPIPRTASVGGWHAVHANGRARFQQVAIDQDAQD